MNVIKFLLEEKKSPHPSSSLLEHKKLLSLSFRMLAALYAGKIAILFTLLINQVAILLGSFPPIATFGILYCPFAVGAFGLRASLATKLLSRAS